MADPVNTFIGSHFFLLTSFNPGTGAYTVNSADLGPLAMGDNEFDTDLTDGSAGDGLESGSEALALEEPGGTDYTDFTYAGYTIGGSPVLANGFGDHYVLTDDPGIAGTSGTAMSTPVFNYAICFRPGTQITTPTGERAIESLQIGDLITTASGAQKPVKWAARMTVPLTRFNRQSMLPICIKQGALGNGLPHRDLFVSNDHALAIDGLLVIAGVLVNGTTIVRCEEFAGDVIEYFHVEVEDHDLLLAEGAAAETFSGKNRERFDNAAEFHALYPDAAPGKLLPMARVTQARQLPKALRSKFFTQVA